MSHSVPIVAAEEPFSIEGMSERDARLFLAGMASGIRAINVVAPRPFYCKGDGHAITGKDLRSLAEEHLTGPQEVGIVAAAIANELPIKYPCKN